MINESFKLIKSFKLKLISTKKSEQVYDYEEEL